MLSNVELLVVVFSMDDDDDALASKYLRSSFFTRSLLHVVVCW